MDIWVVRLFLPGPLPGSRQVSGYKLVRLVSNAYSLYFFPVSGGEFDSGFIASAKWDDLEELPTLDVVLGPGDVLLFPPWLWHSTKTVDPPSIQPIPTGQTDRHANLSIGITCRFPTPTAAVKNDLMLSLFRTVGGKHGIPSGSSKWARFVPLYSQFLDYVNEVRGTMPPWDDTNDCWSSKRTACRKQGVNQ